MNRLTSASILPIRELGVKEAQVGVDPLLGHLLELLKLLLLLGLLGDVALGVRVCVTRADVN